MSRPTDTTPRNTSPRRSPALPGIWAPALRLVGPLAVTLLTLIYFREAHLVLLFGPASHGWWCLALLMPPVALELVFTRVFEAARFGWRGHVLLGLALRLLFVAALFYLFVWETLALKNTPDIVIPLVSKWPFVAEIAWAASPGPAIVLGAVLVGCYLLLTVRWGLFRLTTSALLPGVATLGLFQLFYFHPTSPLRLRSYERPAAVERVFPHARHGDLRGVVAARDLRYPREVYVHPQDEWAVATFGSTFGDDIRNKPNLLWFELRGGGVQAFRADTIRRFDSECPERIFVAPWHDARLLDYRPGAAELRAHPLPETVDGHPVEELMHTYHACGRGRVYVVNNRTPALFAWDTGTEEVTKVVPLAGAGGLMLGDSLWVIGRNPVLGRLYLVLIGRRNLVELDEEDLVPLRYHTLPHDPLDLQVSPDGRELAIPAAFDDVLWLLDAESLAVRREVPIPRHCRRVAYSLDGRRLFVASYLTGELITLDPASGRELSALYVAPKLEGLHVTARYVYLLSAEGLFRVPLATLSGQLEPGADRRRRAGP